MILAILTMTLANGKSNTTEFEPITLTRDTYPNANAYTEYFYNNMTDTENESLGDAHLDFIKAYGEVAGNYGNMVQEENFTAFLLEKGMYF